MPASVLAWSASGTRWLMPQNSREYLTSRYGFITDYLAEAFHDQLSHTNRSEEVSQRIRLGSAVEGRDEKGIAKTVCALLNVAYKNGFWQACQCSKRGDADCLRDPDAARS